MSQIFRECYDRGRWCCECGLALYGRLATVVNDKDYCFKCSPSEKELAEVSLDKSRNAGDYLNELFDYYGEAGKKEKEKEKEKDVRDDNYNYWRDRDKWDNDKWKKPASPIVKYEDINIEIAQRAYQKLFYYIDACPTETSGLFSVTKKSDSLYVVDDLWLLKNYASGGYTDLDKKAMVQFMTQRVREKKDMSNIRGWWHSHASMGVFWSGTDDATANRFIETMADKKGFWVSIVGNKKHELKGRVDTNDPEWTCLNENLKPYCVFPEDAELKKACEIEVKEKVKAYQYKWKGGRSGKWNNNDWDKRGSGLSKSQRKKLRKAVRDFRRGVDERNAYSTDRDGVRRLVHLPGSY